METQRQEKILEINEIMEKKNNSIQMLNSKQKIFDEKSEFFYKINYFKDLYKRQKEVEEEISLESLNMMTIQVEIEKKYEDILDILSYKFKESEINITNIDKVVYEIINVNNKEDLSLDDMKNEINELKINIYNINMDIEKNVNKLKEIPSRDEILYMISEKDKEYENANVDIEAVNKAEKILEECKDIIKSQYSKRILDDVNCNMNMMTFGKYKINSIDDIIGFNTNGLSAATEDQFYLSWRIAALDVLSNNKYKLPLVVDEPFAQYDDKRLEEAMKILDKVSKERQVIIFTCHKRNIDILKVICPQKYNLICI
jgi:DNA repair exonuclease SbcCD ATPase subunit